MNIEDYVGHKTWRALYIWCIILDIMLIPSINSAFLSAVIVVILVYLIHGQNESIKDIEKVFKEQGINESEYPSANSSQVIILGFILLALATWYAMSNP
jgi:predicted membrane chloride channel (bestrophin family)